MELVRPSGVVALCTDFGTADPYVGLMKGMVLRSHPRAILVDLCHDVPPQDVAFGAFVLAAARGRFPGGTVHVAVVDPGVGTARAALAVHAHSCYWLGPDNGVLSPALEAEDAEVRILDLGHLPLGTLSRTFHGRDLFAPVAGWLASGRYGFQALGPRADDPIILPDLRQGPPRVIHVDRFGNLLTNVAPPPGLAALRIQGRRAPLHATYAEAAEGSLLCVVNSYDLLEVAVCRGNAAETLGVSRGATVDIEVS
jgi:S-adenosylmethionine hydrolase